MKRAIFAVFAAFTLMLAAAVPANAAMLGIGYSNWYDGVRIGAQANGQEINGDTDARVHGIEVWAAGDAATLEGGCTSGNHAVTFRVFIIGTSGNIAYDSGERWLCKSGDYTKYLSVDPAVRVACRAAKVKVNWLMHDNFGADDSGSFSFYANRYCD